MGYSKRFYRYISKHHNSYQIRKNGVHYGWYDDIRWALYDRDRLEECNWDLGEFVYLPETPNPYLTIELPPFGLYNYRQYIYPTNSGTFRIQKSFDGTVKYYGTFRTLDEAILRRNELMEMDWNEHSK